MPNNNPRREEEADDEIYDESIEIIEEGGEPFTSSQLLPSFSEIIRMGSSSTNSTTTSNSNTRVNDLHVKIKELFNQETYRTTTYLPIWNYQKSHNKRNLNLNQIKTMVNDYRQSLNTYLKKVKDLQSKTGPNSKLNECTKLIQHYLKKLAISVDPKIAAEEANVVIPH